MRQKVHLDTDAISRVYADSEKPNFRSTSKLDRLALCRGRTKNFLALNALLADMQVIYSQAKDFHWCLAGKHFRSYCWLEDFLDRPVLATVDLIVEAVCTRRGKSSRSVAHVVRLHRVQGEDATLPDAQTEFQIDNENVTTDMRATQSLPDDIGEIISASVLEMWSDETARDFDDSETR